MHAPESNTALLDKATAGLEKSSSAADANPETNTPAASVTTASRFGRDPAIFMVELLGLDAMQTCSA
jgi:hypothetical protein